MRLGRVVRVLIGLGALLASARSPVSAGDATRSFAESDRNGDGTVARREMERRALEVFYFADTDKNGHLTREEYGALVLQDDFVTMDADRDGRVSVREFVAARTRDFDAADRDHDGVLSADEVKAPADGGAGR